MAVFHSVHWNRLWPMEASSLTLTLPPPLFLLLLLILILSLSTSLSLRHHFFFIFYFAIKTITIKNYLLLQLKWQERGALEEKKNSLKKLFLRSARPCKFPRPSSEMRGGGYTSSRYSLGHVWVTELWAKRSTRMGMESRWHVDAEGYRFPDIDLCRKAPHLPSCESQLHWFCRVKRNSWSDRLRMGVVRCKVDVLSTSWQQVSIVNVSSL